MTDLGDIYGLLDECERRGVVLVMAGGRLTLDGPRGALTPDLVDRLRAHRDALRDLLFPRPGESVPWDEDELPVPCVKCGSLDAWWTMTGQRRCAVCDPPTRAVRARERAERIRRRCRTTAATSV